MSNMPDDRLFQEDLRTEPFWMLVACVLVNVTRWAQARPVLDGIRARWPTAAGLAAADLSEVEQVVRCLGLGRGRAAKLVASQLRGREQNHDRATMSSPCRAAVRT